MAFITKCVSAKCTSRFMNMFQSKKNGSASNSCHLFMYSQKRSPIDCVIKLPDNRIFKALLWIKKSFKSIDFGLAEHALVPPPTHPCTGWVDFDWSGSYEITIYIFTVVIIYSYLSDSTKTQHLATHLDIHNF